MKRFGIHSLLVIIVIAATAGLFPARAFATSPAILITPAILQLKIDPGKSAIATVSIINSSDSDREFHLKLRSFNTGNDAGQPVLDDSINTPLNSWIVPTASNFTAPAGLETKISFTVDVPVSAKPGSYRTAILFSDDAPQIAGKLNGTAIAAEAGPLLFVRVNGDADEQVSITSFSAEQTINENLPIQFHIRLENSGTVDLSPVGTINIVPQLAIDTGSYRVNFNPNGGMVLAASTRNIASEWNVADGWHVGFYQAQVVMAYGQNNKVITATSDFWVLPWKAVLALATVVGLIMALVWNRRLSLNRAAITRQKHL